MQRTERDERIAKAAEEMTLLITEEWERQGLDDAEKERRTAAFEAAVANILGEQS